MRARVWCVLILLASAVWVCACGARQTPGEDAKSDGPRLAVLSPALAITLRDLGRSDLIVARHAWDMSTDATVPVGGDQRGIDYEVMLRVDPDVVVMEAGAEPVPSRLHELATTRGWKIVRHPMLTLEDVRRAILAMDNLASGREATTPEGRTLLERLDAATQRNKVLTGRGGRVLMLMSATPPAVLGPGSFHYEIGTSIGLEMLPRDGAAFMNIGLEELRSLAPDTLVLIIPGAEAESLASLIEPLRGLGMRAVEDGRVILLTGREWLTPSTAMIGFAEALVEEISQLPEVDNQSSKK